MKRIIYAIIILFCFVLIGCNRIEDRHKDNIYYFLKPSEGSTIEKDGNLRMVTNIEDNRFSCVELQLWTDFPVSHIKNIATANEGKQTGLYMHKLDTGYYILRLKANSNKKDESVFARVLLINGKSYTYSYNVKEFGEKSVLVSDFKFKLN